jgi:hypothetical protein
MSSSADMPPEVRAWFEAFGTPAAAPFRAALGFMFQLFAGAIFSTLGGVLVAVFMNREGVPPAVGGDPIPPPPLPGNSE